MPVDGLFFKGIVVQEVTRELGSRLGIRDTKGLIISEVKPGSAAEEVEITAGDMIIEINGQRPDTLEKYNAAASMLKKDDVARLLLKRPDGATYCVAVKSANNQRGRAHNPPFLGTRN